MSRFEVKSFCSPPDPELICGICMNVLDDPQETPCRHAFCKLCITTALENKRRCPLCRRRCKTYELRSVIPLVQNLINKLEMKCANFRDGQEGISCKEIIKKEYYLDHVKNCDFAYVDCPYSECKALVLSKDKWIHKQKCEYRLVTCTKGCETQYKWKDRSTHCCIKALKKLVTELVGINKDLMKVVEAELQEKAHHSSTRVGSSHRSGDAGSSRSRSRTRRLGTSGSSYIPHTSETLQNYLTSVASATHGTSTRSSEQNDSFRRASRSNASRSLLGAWGLLGFGSVSGAEEASNDAQSALYENYGPPVVDVDEEDVYANYVTSQGGEEAETNQNEQLTDEAHRLPPSDPDPILNIAPHNDNFHPDEQYDYDSGEEEEWDDYNEAYNNNEPYDYDESYEDYPWTDEEEQESETGEQNNEDDRNDDSLTDPDDRNHNDGEQEQSESSEGLSGAHDEPIAYDNNHEDNDEHRSEENPDAEATETFGSACMSTESMPGTSDGQQKRFRDSETDQQDGAGASKKCRVDASSPSEVSRNTELQESSADQNRNAVEEGDVRRSARLRGVNPAPSSIPNVDVPLSTVELLERYAESEDESSDPSWDDDYGD